MYFITDLLPIMNDMRVSCTDIYCALIILTDSKVLNKTQRLNNTGKVGDIVNIKYCNSKKDALLFLWVGEL